VAAPSFKATSTYPGSDDQLVEVIKLDDGTTVNVDITSWTYDKSKQISSFFIVFIFPSPVKDQKGDIAVAQVGKIDIDCANAIYNVDNNSYVGVDGKPVITQILTKKWQELHEGDAKSLVALHVCPNGQDVYDKITSRDDVEKSRIAT
jgi:hypothetical protein